MAITVKQRWQGARVIASDAARVESEYLVSGTNDEFLAAAALEAGVDQLVGGLIKESSEITDRVSDLAWAGRVVWGQFEKKEIGDSQFAFDTTGGTIRRTQSLSTISKTAESGETAPDFNGAIGVSDNGVEGVDVTSPSYKFSETHFLSTSTVNESYKATVFGLTGLVNNSPYKGFASGECLFLGASGTLRDYQTWEISYSFEASVNAANIAIGSSIVVPLKDGFDYLWIRYSESEDTDAGRLVRKPVAAYVERVYRRGELALLGIGN